MASSTDDLGSMNAPSQLKRTVSAPASLPARAPSPTDEREQTLELQVTEQTDSLHPSGEGLLKGREPDIDESRSLESRQEGQQGEERPPRTLEELQKPSAKIQFGSISPSDPLLSPKNYEVGTRNRRGAQFGMSYAPSSASSRSPARPSTRPLRLPESTSSSALVANVAALRRQCRQLLEQLTTSEDELTLLQADTQENSWLTSRLVAAEARVAELERESQQLNTRSDVVNGREHGSAEIHPSLDAPETTPATVGTPLYPAPSPSPPERRDLILRQLLQDLESATEKIQELLQGCQSRNERIDRLEKELLRSRKEKADLLAKLFEA